MGDAPSGDYLKDLGTLHCRYTSGVARPVPITKTMTSSGVEVVEPVPGREPGHQFARTLPAEDLGSVRTFRESAGLSPWEIR
jgi:hypothetical protein